MTLRIQMIMDKIVKSIYIGTLSSVREVSRFRIRKGKSSRTSRGLIRSFIGTRPGRFMTTFGEGSFVVFGEKARRSIVARSRGFFARARRQILIWRSVAFKRIWDICRRRRSLSGLVGVGTFGIGVDGIASESSQSAEMFVFRILVGGRKLSSSLR